MQALAYISIVIVGGAVGMVINYLADLLPTRRRIGVPICLSCESPQSWVNYLVWPRNCPACGKRRRYRTWVVEISMIVLSVWLWLFPPAQLGYSLSFLLLGYFALVAVIDLEHRLILYVTSVFGALLGLLVGVKLHGWTSTLVGGITGFGMMLGFYFFGAILMGWLAKRRGKVLEEDALGFGDVSLSGVLGLILGWPGVLLGLVITVLLGGLFSLIYLIGAMILRRYRFDLAIPYGPFLLLSATALLFGRELVFKILGW